MRVSDLIPRRSETQNMPARSGNGDGDPVRALQAEVNRAFDNFWRMFDFPLPRGLQTELEGIGAVRVDVSETDDEVRVTAELPGMDEQDIDLSIANDSLTLRGEKKVERDKEEEGYVLRERSFGRVERTIPLPDGVDPDGVKATFKNGVLTVTIPKTDQAKASVKHIPVQAN